MLTIFTTAKPFLGHVATIQRNALQSWKALHPDIEIILFGADDGAAAVAQEFTLRHEPHVERNQHDTKRLDYMFTHAQSIARHDLLCYINCDIILMDDFIPAVERVRAAHREFLMVGRRWDADIAAPLHFSPERRSPDRRVEVSTTPASQTGGHRSSDPRSPDWQESLRQLVLSRGRRRTAEWIDYFVFTRGLFGPGMPPFVLRVFWDNWLVWKALDSGKPVVDASSSVMAVHQNHDYGYHPQGKAGVWSGEEASLNGKLAGGWRHLRTIADATELLTPTELKSNIFRSLSTIKRYVRQAARFFFYDVWRPVWFFILALTRPLRRRLRPR